MKIFYLFAVCVFYLALPANKLSANSLYVQQVTPVDKDSSIYVTSPKDSALNEADKEAEAFKPSPGMALQSPTKNKNTEQSNERNFRKRNQLIIKIFGEKKLDEFKGKLLKYVRNNFSGRYRIFYSKIVDNFFIYPIIFVFVILIFFFLLHVIFILLILKYTNRSKNYNERYKLIYKEFYEMVTLAYLFEEIDWNTYVSRLKRINRRKNRKILIQILLNFHDNLKGGLEKQIPQIYTQLKLELDSFKSVNSFFYFNKVKGLHELTNLYPEGALEVLPKLMKHSNENVRAEAQKAYIILHPDDPFHFLLTLNKPFSRWTQLSAFSLLRMPQLKVPSFSNYLGSEHYDVQVFCVQMIIYFQQLENVSLIFKLLRSPLELIRFLAYTAINNLRLYEGRVIIKNKYRGETEKNKKEIVKALCNIGTDEDIDFLEIIFKSESTALQIEACRTMYFMSPESKSRLMNIRKEVKSDLNLFIEHVTDLRN